MKIKRKASQARRCLAERNLSYKCDIIITLLNELYAERSASSSCLDEVISGLDEAASSLRMMFERRMRDEL